MKQVFDLQPVKAGPGLYDVEGNAIAFTDINFRDVETWDRHLSDPGLWSTFMFSLMRHKHVINTDIHLINSALRNIELALPVVHLVRQQYKVSNTSPAGKLLLALLTSLNDAISDAEGVSSYLVHRHLLASQDPYEKAKAKARKEMLADKSFTDSSTSSCLNSSYDDDVMVDSRLGNEDARDVDDDITDDSRNNVIQTNQHNKNKFRSYDSEPQSVRDSISKASYYYNQRQQRKTKSSEGASPSICPQVAMQHKTSQEISNLPPSPAIKTSRSSSHNFCQFCSCFSAGANWACFAPNPPNSVRHSSEGYTTSAHALNPIAPAYSPPR